jgi:hypothetical protein
LVVLPSLLGLRANMTDSTPEPAFFSLAELRAAFELVTDEATAARLTEIWKWEYGDHLVDERVVRLPDVYGVNPVGHPEPHASPRADSVLGHEHRYDRELETFAGHTLVRFTDLTLTLLAGSSQEVRRRFDNLGVPFARKTVDSPDLWGHLVGSLRARARPH